MPGETLLNERYELVAQQGSGGMSVIYKAQDRSLGRMVAVKILRPSLTKDPSFLEKFQQEARSVAVMSHPNIVTVHDVGSDGATHYIVMEIIEGQDLKKIIRTHGALPFDRALSYSIQICAGLGFAHRSHLVHADVKPQNVLINRDDIIKITDFGIAQAVTDTMPQTRSDVVWGSPHYFAPEQARGEKPSPASDVYSIGVVMFEMFTGRLPYVGTSQRELALAHLQAKIPLAREFNPNVPEVLSNIIAKVMSKRPNDRYKHADQLGHILQQLRERAKAPQRPSALGPLPGESRAKPPATGLPSATAAPRQGIPGPQVTRSGTPIPAPRPTVSATAPAAQPFQPAPSAAATDDSAIPMPPNPLFNRDGTLNLEATGGYTSPFMPQRQEKSSGIDAVTIIMILLAIIAVAGLAPLYLFGVLPALT